MEDDFDDLSYGRFAQAVDRCAFWLEKTVGKHEETIVPKVIFASLPRHDLRAVLLILAAPKTGHQMYWSQPFGETDYIVKALAGMDCDTFLKPSPCPEVVEDVLRQRPLRTVDLPHLDAWLSPHYDPDAEVYPYTLPTDNTEAASQPMMVFQTSGTTADPKPIVVRLGSASKIDTYHKLPQLGQQPWLFAHLTGQRVLSTFGWYQYAGFSFHITGAVYYDYVIVIAPEIHDWSAESIEAAIHYGNVQSCFLYPAACVEFCLDENKHRLPALRQLKLIVYGGSSIPFWVGNILNQYTQVGQIIGSTEAAIFPQEIPREKEEWPYLRLQPQSGVEFRPYLDNYYHMVVVRQKDLEDWQGAFVNFPELDEFLTGDLFERHATDPDLWLSSGRIADLFTLQDGRVFNPVPIEVDIAENPALILAMICGLSSTGKLVVLLTPRTPLAEGESPSEFVDRVWPSVERSFVTKGPKWILSFLDRDFINVTPQGLPIQRTGAKWNVNRKKTLALHLPALEKQFGELTLSCRAVAPS
ncbi:hypothetical protein VP1G_06998 [Cytospora mali]|uniref:AMP-dependent synthetase/ligase domain-containing protein n=1 Tax=Cytospora mali TaxID=578113 RepID=A0A194V769_CYTMA|nr:hypothetical protein VP1G_06998 [Valsa mali var. pyri (nom. inval.)]